MRISRFFHPTSDSITVGGRNPYTNQPTTKANSMLTSTADYIPKAVTTKNPAFAPGFFISPQTYYFVQPIFLLELRNGTRSEAVGENLRRLHQGLR